jgi:hypothetical protein
MPCYQDLHTFRMERNTFSDDTGTDPREAYPGDRDTYPGDRETRPDQPETYWRRRAAALAAGLGVLALLAWAFSGGGGQPAPPAPDTSAAAGSAATHPSGSASLGDSAGASPTAGASAGASGGAGAAVPGLGSQGTSGLPSAASSAGGKSAKHPASAKTAAPAAVSTEPGGRCAPGAVVLSLFSGSRSYGAGQDPEFGVDAVSTAPGTCTFDLGPAQLYLVVMSAGRVIWDSADCARGDGTQPTRLTRGVPVQKYFTWNRAITLPGCVTLASSARPGSYTAQARTSAITSSDYSFRLDRHASQTRKATQARKTQRPSGLTAQHLGQGLADVLDRDHL